MNGGAAGAAAGGAAAAGAAIAQAIKAFGVIVKVDASNFLRVLNRQAEPLVVIAPAGFLGKKFRYLTSYKGLAFFVQTSSALQLPGACEVVQARKICIPG